MDLEIKQKRLEDRYKEVRKNKNSILAQTLLEDSEALSMETDQAIISVSQNKFIGNKGKRLKDLGESHTQIKSILKKTQKEMERSNSDESALSPFLKTFSARDILNKVNPELLNEIESDEPELATKDILNKVNPELLNEIESDKPNTEPSANPELLTKDNRVDVSVNLDNPEYEPVKLNIKEDTNSLHIISENNEKIYQRLADMGETQMANHVHDMMERVKVGPKHKYVSEINQNTNQLRQMSTVNTEIEGHLGELRYLLRTKQDTGIESVEDRLAEEVVAEKTVQERVKEEESSGFIETLLGMLFGKGLMTLLTAGKGVLGFAMGILRPALGWLLGALTTGIKGIFGALFKGPWEMFKNLSSRFDGFLTGTFEVFRKGYESFKGFVTNGMDALSTRFNKAIGGLRNALSAANDKILKMGKVITDLFKKIPGISKLVDFMGFGVDKVKKLSQKTADVVGKGVSKGVSKGASWVGKAIDSTVSAVKAGGKAVYAVGKGAVDWTTGRLAKIGQGISSVAKKVGSRFSSIPGRLTEHVNRTGGKAPGGVFKKMGKFAKVLKAVPFLGQALAVGFAAKAAHSGWNNAGDLYGIKQNEVSAPGKAASALGAVVKDLLWPIPINQRTIANAALALTGSSFSKGGEPVSGDFKEGSLGDVSQFEQDIPLDPPTDAQLSDIPFKNEPELTDLNRANLQNMDGSSGISTELQPPNAPTASATGVVTSTNIQTGEVTTRAMTKDEELEIYRNRVKRRYDTLNRSIEQNRSPVETSRHERLLRDSISSLKRYLKNNNIDPASIPEARTYRRENLEELSKTPETPEKSVESDLLDITGTLDKSEDPQEHDPSHDEDITVIRDKKSGVPYRAENTASTSANAISATSYKPSDNGRIGQSDLAFRKLQEEDSLYGMLAEVAPKEASQKEAAKEAYKKEEVNQSSDPSATFGDPYNGEASDFNSEDPSAEMLKSLGLDASTNMSEFGNNSKPQTPKTTPENNKTKHQSNIESTMVETQDLANSENLILEQVNTAMTSMQDQINQISQANSQINQTIQTGGNTGSIFAINNDEYNPSQELRY